MSRKQPQGSQLMPVFFLGAWLVRSWIHDFENAKGKQTFYITCSVCKDDTRYDWQTWPRHVMREHIKDIVEWANSKGVKITEKEIRDAFKTEAG